MSVNLSGLLLATMKSYFLIRPFCRVRAVSTSECPPERKCDGPSCNTIQNAWRNGCWNGPHTLQTKCH